MGMNRGAELPCLQGITAVLAGPVPHLPAPPWLPYLQALARLNETWAKVSFVFVPHHGAAGAEVSTVKMVEEEFEMLEDNQVLVQVGGR